MERPNRSHNDVISQPLVATEYIYVQYMHYYLLLYVLSFCCNCLGLERGSSTVQYIMSSIVYIYAVRIEASNKRRGKGSRSRSWSGHRIETRLENMYGTRPIRIVTCDGRSVIIRWNTSNGRERHFTSDLIHIRTQQYAILSVSSLLVLCEL